MSSNTLTSLAILKVNVDHGRDYLDYLRPFILDVLAKNSPERITDVVVTRLISKNFGPRDSRTRSCDRTPANRKK